MDSSTILSSVAHTPIPLPDLVKRARIENPKMRERDLARQIGLSEAEFVASFCGETVQRIEPRFDTLFPGLQDVGEVMALTRNESAVHEKIGVFERFIHGRKAALMLGKDIDTRMFPKNWVHGFAVERNVDGNIQRSLQFFDAYGEAVQKIHARPATARNRWDELVETLLSPDQSPEVSVLPHPTDPSSRRPTEHHLANALRERWNALTDPHQFHGMLQDFDMHRLTAFELAGADLAWKLDPGSPTALLRAAASEALPIMCFVGNRGCIQIHSGPVKRIMDKGPWINVLDERFHLHLRTDHIADVWAVRKPADKEYVTSVEAFDRSGNQIIQFFGVRQEGQVERADWRDLVKHLPVLEQPVVLGGA